MYTKTYSMYTKAYSNSKTYSIIKTYYITEIHVNTKT